jgi:hypothetical protein
MKKITKILFVLSFILLFTGCDSFGKEEEEYKYKLTLYNLNEIENVTIDTLGQYENKIEISDKSKIKVIYYMFEGKKTNKKGLENIGEVEKLYSVTFNIESRSRKLDIYKDGTNYFINDSEGGKYKSNKEDFEKLESMIKDNDFRYKTDIYKLDEIKKIVISSMGQFDEPVSFTDDKHIRILYDVFSEKQSNIKSTSENPENPEALYHVKFSDNLGMINPKEFYIYRKESKFYIEQPLNGIFVITESEYDIVKNYFDKNSALPEEKKEA